MEDGIIGKRLKLTNTPLSTPLPVPPLPLLPPLFIGIPDTAIRWMSEDCLSFVQREVKRGNKYEGVFSFLLFSFIFFSL